MPEPQVDVLGPPVPRQTYPAGMVELFLRLVLDAACSLRCGSAVMGLLKTLWSAFPRTPVPNTGQWWLLRIGLFELTRAKEAADDWCWILDHTIQIGKVKCLLIAGVRLSHFRQLDRPLEHRDLQIMALEPVATSNGEVVCRQLQATCEKTGIVPRMLLSDEGTDLLSGYQEFSPLRPQVAICRDIKHLAANFLKHELERDERWKRFTSAAGSAKQRLAQTALAHLLPPTPRSKARYMNLEELVTWGSQTLRYLDRPHAIAGQPPDRATLDAKLGWLREHRAALVEWSEAMQVVNAVCHYVRKRGYHSHAARELKRGLGKRRKMPLGDRLAAKLIDAVTEQSQAAHPGERLVGSSECIESLIGKGKRLEGQQSLSGFTKMVLGLAAAVVTPSVQYVSEALRKIKTADVANWCRQHLGISIQAQRRQALRSPGTKTG
jgi:hypothetical protein